MVTLLWLLAVALALVGVAQLIQGHPVLGLVLLALACAIGPGGWSLFGSR